MSADVALCFECLPGHWVDQYRCSYFVWLDESESFCSVQSTRPDGSVWTRRKLIVFVNNTIQWCRNFKLNCARAKAENFGQLEWHHVSNPGCCFIWHRVGDQEIATRQGCMMGVLAGVQDGSGWCIADFDGKAYEDPECDDKYLMLKAGVDLFMHSCDEESGWAFGDDCMGNLGWFPFAYWKALSGCPGWLTACGSFDGRALSGGDCQDEYLTLHRGERCFVVYVDKCGGWALGRNRFGKRGWFLAKTCLERDIPLRRGCMTSGACLSSDSCTEGNDAFEVAYSDSSAMMRAQCHELKRPGVNASDRLFGSVKKNDVHGVCQALLENVPIDRRDDKGWTALFYATFHGHSEVVSALLSFHADVNVRDSICFSPLDLVEYELVKMKRGEWCNVEFERLRDMWELLRRAGGVSQREALQLAPINCF